MKNSDNKTDLFKLISLTFTEKVQNLQENNSSALLMKVRCHHPNLYQNQILHLVRIKKLIREFSYMQNVMSKTDSKKSF